MHMANGSTGGCWLTETRGLLWSPPPLFHLTAWNLNILQGNKNTGSLMCWKNDNGTAVFSKLWGSPRNMGDFSVVCASLLNLSWDQRLREALIRGRAVSRVSYEPGPPTSLLFVCTMSPGCAEKTALQTLKGWLSHNVVRHSRFHSHNDAGGAVIGLVYVCVCVCGRGAGTLSCQLRGFGEASLELY